MKTNSPQKSTWRTKEIKKEIDTLLSAFNAKCYTIKYNKIKIPATAIITQGWKKIKLIWGQIIDGKFDDQRHM